MVETFFWLPLKAGAALIAYVEIFLAILVLLVCMCVCASMGRIRKQLEEEQGLRATEWRPFAIIGFITIVVFNLVKLVAAGLLLYAASSGKANFICLWFATNTVCLLILTLSGISSLVAICAGYYLSIANFLIFQVLIVLRFYAFVAMASLYSRLDES